MRTAYPALVFGDLPIEAINKALGTELEPGQVRLSRTAHRHIAEDHPDDYAYCLSALAEAVKTPTFVGQSPHHANNFEIIRRVPRADRKAVLVAVGLERDERGAYSVKSCYLVEPEKVDARRTNSTLKQIPP